MRRGLSIAFVLLGLAVAAPALGAPPTAPAAKPKTPPLLPAGVRIAGVRVGGLDTPAATRAVELAFEKPLPVVVAGIVHALTVSTRLPLRFETALVRPATTRADIGAVILINRGLNRLTWFDNGTVRRFPVATGQAIYPTPAGRFQIVVKWKNPW